jgi:hypothetical protein
MRGLLLAPLFLAGLLSGCDTPKDAPAPPRQPAKGDTPAKVSRPVDAPLEKPRGPHLTLVENGAPRATIVVMKEAVSAPAELEPARLSGAVPLPTKIAGAARDLQVYLQKMSGAKLPIVGDDKAPSGTLILVGRSALTRDLDTKVPSGLTPQRNEEGFVIIAKGDRLLLAGNDADPYHGTEYAVANFLYRQGVRWYMPGEFGDVVPRRPSYSPPRWRCAPGPTSSSATGGARPASRAPCCNIAGSCGTA